MAGTGYMCLGCGKIFRKIYGSTIKELGKMLEGDEDERFVGDDFYCCGKDNLKTLYELDKKEELEKLQKEWINVIARIYGGLKKGEIAFDVEVNKNKSKI